jgi:hypothetical protein
MCSITPVPPLMLRIEINPHCPPSALIGQNGRIE